MQHPNRIKIALREGRLAYGYNLSFPSPWIVEILGRLDFDFVWLGRAQSVRAIKSKTFVARPRLLV